MILTHRIQIWWALLRRVGALIYLPCQEISWTISNNGGSALLICTMQDSMGKSALRFGNNGSSVTKPDVKNFEPPCINSLPSSEQNFRPLNLYYRKCWQPRLPPSTAWISNWPSSTWSPHPSRSLTAILLANVASVVRAEAVHPQAPKQLGCLLV